MVSSSSVASVARPTGILAGLRGSEPTSVASAASSVALAVSLAARLVALLGPRRVSRAGRTYHKQTMPSTMIKMASRPIGKNHMLSQLQMYIIDGRRSSSLV